jgi:hypothetical protein
MDVDSRFRRTRAACPACRAAQQSGRWILQAARDAVPAADPSPFVLARVRAAAREIEPEPRVLWFRHPVTQSLACAAAVLIVLGGWFFLSSLQQTLRTEELGTILSAMSCGMENEVVGSNGTQEPNLRRRKLANRLMELEGVQAEHLSDWQLPMIPDA